MSIKLRTDIPVKPVNVKTARQVPVYLEEPARKLVKHLEDSGIIRRLDHDEVTEWCSPAHFVPKAPNESRPEVDARLVTDFTGLNKYIERPVHPFDSPRDLMRKVPPGMKFFARFDALHGYYQVNLDARSQALTTFILAFGRFQYCVAPQGLNSSGDIFCYLSDLPVQDLPWLLKIVDDFLIFGETLSALFRRIRVFLQRMRSSNIKLSRKKFKIADHLQFAGFVVSSQGLKPDPAKLQGISDFPPPRNTTDLKSFLGLAQQLGHFVPDLSQATSGMKALLKKNTAWNWTPAIQAEFESAKRVLCSEAVCQPFDPKLETYLLTDAARLHGMGYALCQKAPEDDMKALKVVACGSKSFSPAESRYATIELECLAIKWAVHDLSFYLAACPIVYVKTDHRPLEGMFLKPLPEISNPRLLRFREALVGYNLDVKWVKGKDHLIADALSRSPVWPCDDDPEDAEFDPSMARVNMAVASDPALHFIFEYGKGCEEHQLIVKKLESGATDSSIDVHEKGLVWNKMSVIKRAKDNASLVLVDGHKILVPKKARPEILRRLHLSHSGEAKTLQAARRLYFWPGMNNEISQMCNNCEACQRLRPAQSRDEVKVTPMGGAVRPMQKLGMDLCQLNDKHYLVVVDRYSSYVWIESLRSLDSEAVVRKLRRIFCEFGYPEVIRSDGGPQFKAAFEDFCKFHGIRHEFSAPHHPESNGLAESAVKSMKGLLKKCEITGEDFQDALLEWRATPRTDGFSPAEAFFGRRLRTQLPAYGDSNDFDPAAFRQARTKSRASNLKSVAARSKKLPKLHLGDHVAIWCTLNKTWGQKGTILETPGNDDNQYRIVLDEGGETTRTRQHIKSAWDAVIEDDAVPEAEAAPQPRRSARIAAKK